jgi:uncharacterized protein YkwD
VVRRSLLAGIAGVAVLLALSVSGMGTAVASVPSHAAEASDEAGTHASGQTSKGKSRRSCRRGGSKRRGARKRRASRKRALRGRRAPRRRLCRRAKRKIRSPAPVSPTLPSEPPPALLPAPPLPPPPPFPPAAPGSCPGADAVPTAANLPTIRSATLCLVNAERTGAGLLPLLDHGQLAAAAQGHADDMAAQGYFSHTSVDGRTFDQRIRNAGYAGRAIAENIAWGSSSLGTPRRIVGAWMSSTGHRANILNGGLSDSGIGVAPRTPGGASGGTYVQDFGAP